MSLQQLKNTMTENCLFLTNYYILFFAKMTRGRFFCHIFFMFMKYRDRSTVSKLCYTTNFHICQPPILAVFLFKFFTYTIVNKHTGGRFGTPYENLLSITSIGVRNCTPGKRNRITGNKETGTKKVKSKISK